MSPPDQRRPAADQAGPAPGDPADDLDDTSKNESRPPLLLARSAGVGLKTYVPPGLPGAPAKPPEDEPIGPPDLPVGQPGAGMRPAGPGPGLGRARVARPRVVGSDLLMGVGAGAADRLVPGRPGAPGGGGTGVGAGVAGGLTPGERGRGVGVSSAVRRVASG